VDAMALDVPVAIIGKKLKEMAPRLWGLSTTSKRRIYVGKSTNL
jgi:hypothetical protein